MTEKRVTEADKAELRDMAALAAAPCPFKVGDVVECVVAEDRYSGIATRAGRHGIVIKVRAAEDRGWHGTDDMVALHKTFDEASGLWHWQTSCTNSWRFRRA